MKAFAIILLAALVQAQEPYYYKWAHNDNGAPPFKFPENIPVPFPETNEPEGNAGYQYQYTPTQPNARPFEAPEDYIPVDFNYQYVLKPSDNFKYNYPPSTGEFDFKFTPDPEMMNLTPEEIKAKSAGVASSVREVGALLSSVKSDDIKAITGELGFGQDFDLGGVSAGINKIGDFIEKGGEAGAQIATDIGPLNVVPDTSEVTKSAPKEGLVASGHVPVVTYLGYLPSYPVPIGSPIVYTYY